MQLTRRTFIKSSAAVATLAAVPLATAANYRLLPPLCKLWYQEGEGPDNSGYYCATHKINFDAPCSHDTKYCPLSEEQRFTAKYLEWTNGMGQHCYELQMHEHLPNSRHPNISVIDRGFEQDGLNTGPMMVQTYEVDSFSLDRTPNGGRKLTVKLKNGRAVVHGYTVAV
jgi:hypothetical protein